MSGLISIIVPIYNSEKTLDRCIRSLINQTYMNIEIILINDGSTDDSLAICRNYANEDKRIIVVDKENEGVSSARNIGIEQSSGEYIMFCDSDDYVSLDWCKTLITSYVDGYLTMCLPCKNKEKDNPPENKFEIAQKKDFIFHQSDGWWPPYNKIYDANTIKQNKVFFPPELSLGEDLVFVLKYLDSIPNEIRIIYSDLYFYQCENNNNSLSKKTPTLSQCEIFNKALKEYLIAFNQTGEKGWIKKNQIIMYDLEKIIIFECNNSQKSFIKKYLCIREIMNTPTYIECCKDSSITKNSFYAFILKNRLAFLTTLFETLL